MKLYTSVGPNPFAVRLFMAEKGISLDLEKIDIRNGESRREPYLSQVNSRGQTPALVLDDGSVLTEITAICEYLNDVCDGPELMGESAQDKAKTRARMRQIDIAITEPMSVGFLSAEALATYKDRRHCLPDAADELKQMGQEGLAWLNDEIAGNTFLVGEKLTVADIILYAFLYFFAQVGQPVDSKNTNLLAWYGRMQAHLSAA